MSDTRRTRTAEAAIVLPPDDLVPGVLHLDGVPLDVELADGESSNVLDLVSEARSHHCRVPGFGSGIVVGGSDDHGVRVIFNPVLNDAVPMQQRRTITLPADSSLDAFRQAVSAARAQDGPSDADGATVSENAQPPRATPRYAEVRLTTAEQIKRRDDLSALGKAWRDYAKLPWWKRLVTHRP